MRGAFGLSAGNLIGSCIFNTFGVVGLAGLILQPPVAPVVVLSPAVIPGLLGLCLVIVVTIGLMRTGWRLTRLEGLLLVALGMLRFIADITYQG